MTIRHALLALLSEGPKYGLLLRQEFETRTGDVWPLNVGQVYTTLQRLERDGLVESSGDEVDGPQKAVRITDAGADELRAWLGTPADSSAPPREELVIKVMIGLTVPGVDVPAMVQVHRRHLIEAMQAFTKLKADAPDDDVALAMVVDAELFRLDASVRWLDSVSARVRRRSGTKAAAPKSVTPTRPRSKV